MINLYIRYTSIFLFYTLVQVLVLNNIILGGVAAPMLYVYVLLLLPASMPRPWVITVGFLLGLTIDLFTNTPGLNALATVVAAFFREPIIGLFNKREIQTEKYSIVSMGWSAYMTFALTLISVHHILLFAVEYFSLFNFYLLLVKCVASVALTTFLVFLIEHLKSSTHD